MADSRATAGQDFFMLFMQVLKLFHEGVYKPGGCQVPVLRVQCQKLGGLPGTALLWSQPVSFPTSSSSLDLCFASSGLGRTRQKTPILWPHEARRVFSQPATAPVPRSCSMADPGHLALTRPALSPGKRLPRRALEHVGAVYSQRWHLVSSEASMCW